MKKIKTALFLSVALNLYFQFQDDIFYKYVDWKYCNGKSHQSVQYGSTYILHIPYVIDLTEYGQKNPTCQNDK